MCKLGLTQKLIFLSNAYWFVLLDWESQKVNWHLCLRRDNTLLHADTSLHADEEEKELTTGKNVKSTFFTCPCHNIYREEAVGLSRFELYFQKLRFS